MTLELPATEIDENANATAIPNGVQTLDMSTPTQDVGMMFNVALEQSLQPGGLSGLDASQTTPKMAPKEGSDAVSSQSSTTTSTQDTGKVGAGSPGDSSSRNAQDGAAPSQNSTISALKVGIGRSGNTRGRRIHIADADDCDTYGFSR